MNCNITANRTPEPMDALADILKTLRISAKTFSCNDFSSPWGIQVDKSETGLFHVIISGSCWLTLGKDKKIRLDTGDIVAFPTGGSHGISDMPESERLPGDKVVAQLLKQQNPFSCCEQKPNNITSLMCGSFTHDTSLNHPFLRDLPCFIHIKAVETPELEWLRMLMKVLACESRTPSPGSSVIIDRLTEVLFIQLLRTHIKNSPKENCNNTCYLSALNDPQIGQALNLIHNENKAILTVEKLGSSVAMSRTAFTDKFSKLIGIPPKTYLLNWRMQKAKTKLATSQEQMFTIAQYAGYSSEAAFSKAFKHFFNITPGKVRKQRLAS
ncbi:MAG: AraC family transcriptional regulator [Alteromonadaceae bacterium]|nr:AraC family transcriptional regulator [Alteromonadaceae bacterium]